MRRILMLLAAIGATVGVGTLRAQQENSTQDLLNLGRRAFDDLEYRASDSIARIALAIPHLTRGQRIQALELAAAARFPVGEADQHPDSAMTPLRALARIAPATALPQTLTWHGLDSLFAVARASTFGASVSVADSTIITGLVGRVTMDVVATRPAVFVLHLARPDDPGLGEVLDSIGPVERGSLHVVPVQGDRPRYPSGNYRLTVIASDPGSKDRIDLVVAGRFVVPPVQIAIPAPHDSTMIRPEFTSPSRVRAIASGILIGAFAYAAGRIYRGSAVSGAGVQPDSRATGWAIALGISTVGLSWYLDHGRRIAPNVAYNVKLRDGWSREQRDTEAANDAARASYRGVIYLTVEDQ